MYHGQKRPGTISSPGRSSGTCRSLAQHAEQASCQSWLNFNGPTATSLVAARTGMGQKELVRQRIAIGSLGPMKVHLVVDGFQAAVQQAIAPELRGQPVAVAVDGSPQAVVFATSTEAQRHRFGRGCGQNTLDAVAPTSPSACQTTNAIAPLKQPCSTSPIAGRPALPVTAVALTWT